MPIAVGSVHAARERRRKYRYRHEPHGIKRSVRSVRYRRNRHDRIHRDRGDGTLDGEASARGGLLPAGHDPDAESCGAAAYPRRDHGGDASRGRRWCGCGLLDGRLSARCRGGPSRTFGVADRDATAAAFDRLHDQSARPRRAACGRGPGEGGRSNRRPGFGGGHRGAAGDAFDHGGGQERGLCDRGADPPTARQNDRPPGRAGRRAAHQDGQPDPDRGHDARGRRGTALRGEGGPRPGARPGVGRRGGGRILDGQQPRSTGPARRFSPRFLRRALPQGPVDRDRRGRTPRP